jgi:hypothetical protein
MESRFKTEEEISKKIDQIHAEIQPALYEFNKGSEKKCSHTEKELNAEILKITMRIKDHYPELSKYIEEMSATIPDERNPGVTKENLAIYLHSLSVMLSRYIAEQGTMQLENSIRFKI